MNRSLRGSFILKIDTVKNIKLALGVFLTIIIIIACGGGGPNEPRKPPKRVKPKAKKITDAGHKLYKNKCVICHGIKGDLEYNGAKNIQDSALSLEDRMELISNGKGLMTPFKGVLSEEQIRQVAEYSLKISKGEVK